VNHAEVWPLFVAMFALLPIHVAAVLAIIRDTDG